MSYSLFMQRFVDGDTGTVPFDVAKPVLERYGKLSQGISGWELSFATSDIADVADVSGDDDEGVSGITLSRPTGSPAMYSFIFAVLQELKMCFFTQDCEAIWATEDLREHVPPDLLAQANDRFEIVTTANALWNDAADVNPTPDG